VTIHTVLLAIDDSPRSLRTVPYATAIARATGARVWAYWAIPDEALRYHAEHRLTRIAERLGQVGVDATTRVERREDPAEAIMATCREVQADLVAMATAAWSPVDRWLHGSVADEVVRQAEVPVLVVPPAERPRLWPASGTLRIVAPLDRSSPNTRALAAAGGLAAALRADLLLLHVIERPRLSSPDMEDPATSPWARERLAEAERWLEEVATHADAGGGRTTTLAVIGDPSNAVAEVADEQDAHLIVMATRGRGGLVRTLLGSVATATLARSRVPLLLLGPAAVDGPTPPR
jgi:nucleotide-binding universal stress UspA family protein